MEHSLVNLAGIIVVGIAAHWLAWRIRLPSILLLLVSGFLVGGVTGWLDPDALLGDLLFPIVSLAVAVILFEGGLSLNVADLGAIRGVVRRLVTVGAVATWGLATLFGTILLDLDIPLAALLGAMLVVTGPTVIIPLLRQIRPKADLATVVRWEGIVNDPIGAILAVLVFDAIMASTAQGTISAAVLGVVRAVLAGGLLGALGAALMVVVLERHWVPDYLQSPMTLAVVISAFTLSDLVMPESGLLAVTVMGSALASQSRVTVRRIVEFKENLRVLLIAVLFVVLAARLPLDDPTYRSPGSLLFLAALIFVVRPASVALATWSSDLGWRDRVFLAWMAPRGIVAAAVASIFALRLGETAYPGAEKLAPVMFLVIVGTVVIYGLTAGLLAKRLGVAVPDPQGLLFIGASRWVRDVAAALSEQGVVTLLIDSNWGNVTAARQRGLRVHWGNVLEDRVARELNLDGIGRVLAVTPNDEVNALALLHVGDEFGRQGTYQLPPRHKGGGRSATLPQHLKGQSLFSDDATAEEISRRLEGGWVVKATPLTATFDYRAFRDHYGEDAVPLFAVGPSRGVTVFTAAGHVAPKPGQTLVSLVKEGEERAEEVA